MVTFYDTHAHLDYPELALEVGDILQRARAAGITRMLSIGTDLESSRRAIALAEKHSNVYAVVGWHPSEVMTAPADFRPALRELVKHPRVAAIGETGLDYYRLPSATHNATPEEDADYKARQAVLFAQHLEVAAECGLNCVIHQRASFEDTLAQIRPFAARTRGVFHCFGESKERLQQILDLGWLVSYTGIVTFKNGQNVRDTVAATPMGKFMLETDSPYLAPVPHRGKRCEPAFVKEIAEMVAQVKLCSLEELSAVTNRTAEEFFRMAG